MITLSVRCTCGRELKATLVTCLPSGGDQGGITVDVEPCQYCEQAVRVKTYQEAKDYYIRNRQTYLDDKKE